MKRNLISMGDIALRRGGSVDPRKYQGEVFELYSIPAFDAGAPEVVAGSAIGSSKKAIQPNDVMISRIVPHIRRACVVGPSNGHRKIASSEWIIFRDERIWPKYLRWVLVGDVFHLAFMRTVSGVGGSLLRARPAEVFKIQVPLPPLAEQKRIARILDAADALRAKRSEALAQLDTLLQSTFLDMFGDPVTNPMGWPKVKSGELFLLPPKIGTITPATGRGYLVVRVGEVGESRIAFERCGRVEVTEKDFAKFSLEQGDTVIARAIGSKNQLGKASFFAGFDEATVIDSHVMRLRPDPIKCDGLWFYSLISSDRGKILLQQTGGATAVQFNINAKQASSLQVALPPLDLQHQFTVIAESIERQKASQQAHLAELDTLFASLQSRAFRGDL